MQNTVEIAEGKQDSEGVQDSDWIQDLLASPRYTLHSLMTKAKTQHNMIHSTH